MIDLPEQYARRLPYLVGDAPRSRWTARGCGRGRSPPVAGYVYFIPSVSHGQREGSKIMLLVDRAFLLEHVKIGPDIAMSWQRTGRLRSRVAASFSSAVMDYRP